MMMPRRSTDQSLAERGVPRVSFVDVVGVLILGAVLTAWLLPALAGVSRSSKGRNCLTNLMQIGYANAIYASQDRADMALPVHSKQFEQCEGHEAGGMCYPPVFVGAYEWGGKSGIGRDSFVTGSPGDPLNSKYGTKAGFGPASRPLNSILYPAQFADHLNPQFNPEGAASDTQLDLKIHRCPADTGYTGVEPGIHCPSFSANRLTSYDHFGTSYSANIFMTAMSVAGSEMLSNSPYLHRLSDIVAPSTTLAYQENNGRWAWAAAPEACDGTQNGLDLSPGVVGYLRGWHGKDWTFNAAFTDGHADSIYMRGYRSELVFPDDPDRQSSFACIIIRGEGWQVDTLPLDLVRTGLIHNGFGRPSYEGCVGNNDKQSSTVSPASDARPNRAADEIAR